MPIIVLWPIKLFSWSWTRRRVLNWFHVIFSYSPLSWTLYLRCLTFMRWGFEWAGTRIWTAFVWSSTERFWRLFFNMWRCIPLGRSMFWKILKSFRYKKYKNSKLFIIYLKLLLKSTYLWWVFGCRFAVVNYLITSKSKPQLK